MATSYLTPNMSLVIPVPTQEPGPNWSFDLNASLTIVDTHNHTSGSGVQVPTGGININADLSFNNIYNLINPRSIRLFPNLSALAGVADLGCIYEAGVDLYYNDGNGNQIRITQSGSVAGSAGTITGLPSGTASASFQAASGTFLFQQATSTGANIDVATVIIRYPGSYPTPSGNYIALEAPSSLSTGYALILPAIPAQTNVMTLSNAGVIASITYDAVGQDMTSVGANAVANSRTRATGTSVGVGGVAISASSGAFGDSSGSVVQVTNLSVTIVTSGRPVKVEVQSDNSSNFGTFGMVGGSGLVAGSVFIYRGGSPLSKFTMAGQTPFEGPPGMISTVDAVGAGTYTYAIFVQSGLSAQVLLQNSVLVAYEL